MRPGRDPVLVPPRPNFGPEPWPEPTWTTLSIGVVTGAALILLAVLVVAFWGITRRNRRSTLAESSQALAESLSSQRPIQLAETIRKALADQFGPTWFTKTTQEIAQASELACLLTSERAREVVALLRLADRAKFAATAHQPGNEELAPYSEVWLAETLSALARRSRSVGASSIRTGK
jgi:hypothetical protein